MGDCTTKKQLSLSLAVSGCLHLPLHLHRRRLAVLLEAPQHVLDGCHVGAAVERLAEARLQPAAHLRYVGCSVGTESRGRSRGDTWSGDDRVVIMGGCAWGALVRNS